MQTRISVALATHNSARYLATLLESLVSQTLPPFELVIGDDASEDGTPGMLRDFARRAPFPVHIQRNSTNRGYIATFLDVAARCRGDAVAFADHDDVWLPQKLELCARALDRSDAMLALHDMRVVDSRLRDLGRTYPGIRSTTIVPALHANILEFHAPGACMIVRRALLDIADAGMRPASTYLDGQRMGHDEWLFFLGNVCGPVALISTPLVLWRRHEDTTTGEVPGERRLTVGPVIDHYRRAAALCEAYGRVLHQIAVGADPPYTGRLTRGAEQYRAAALHWRGRVSLYNLAQRRRRIGVLWRLVTSGAYRGRHLGGLGLAALPKDVVAGLLLRYRGA